MPKQSSRHVAKKKNDLDLTPPEEIRARRIKRLVLLGAVVACVLGMGIYFSARPFGGAIKAWQSRRLARQAFAQIEQRKWSDANAKARDAYLLRPTEPESWRAIARLASRTNQWPSALEWWKKVDDAARLTVEDRRDYIAAAIIAGEMTVAGKQVQVLMAQRTPVPIDIVWAGQLASRQNDPVLAADYAQRALGDKRAKPYETMAAAALLLSVTSPSSEPYAGAWRQIEDIARDPKNPASLDALTVLAREEAIPPTSAIGGDTSLSLESTSPPQPTLAPQLQGIPPPNATSPEAHTSPMLNQGAAVSSGASIAAGEGGSSPATASAKEASSPGISPSTVKPSLPDDCRMRTRSRSGTENVT